MVANNEALQMSHACKCLRDICAVFGISGSEFANYGTEIVNGFEGFKLFEIRKHLGEMRQNMQPKQSNWPFKVLATVKLFFFAGRMKRCFPNRQYSTGKIVKRFFY